MKTVFDEAITLLEELDTNRAEIRKELPRHLATIIRALGIDSNVVSSKHIPEGTIIIGTGCLSGKNTEGNPIYTYWQLGKPLEQQKPETIDFLYNLICKQ